MLLFTLFIACGDKKQDSAQEPVQETQQVEDTQVQDPEQEDTAQNTRA